MTEQVIFQPPEIMAITRIGTNTTMEKLADWQKEEIHVEDQTNLIQSYPPRALDRRLQEDWARDAREGHWVLMSLRVDFESMG